MAKQQIYTQMSLGLSPQLKSIKNPSQSTEESINKMWYIHTMKYYSPSKVLTQPTKWVNLENIK